MLTFLLPKLTEATKAKKNDSKFSTMTDIPKTMPVQNLLRYISFKINKSHFSNIFFRNCQIDSVLHAVDAISKKFEIFELSFLLQIPIQIVHFFGMAAGVCKKQWI